MPPLTGTTAPVTWAAAADAAGRRSHLLGRGPVALVTVVQGDGGALGGERRGDGTTQEPAGARDEDALAVELQVHVGDGIGARVSGEEQRREENLAGSWPRAPPSHSGNGGGKHPAACL